MRRLSLVWVFPWLLGACSTFAPKEAAPPPPLMPQSSGERPAETAEGPAADETSASLEKGTPAETVVKGEESEALPPGGEDSELSSHPKLLLEVNEKVEAWIDYFTKKDPAMFTRFLNRGHQYRAVVEEVLAEYQIPKEFYYLAMIESGYQNHAVSTAKAVGVWQFIPGTAVRYGLRLDRHVDERRDVRRATRAAAQYLRDLYNVFGSWRLAMASYNAGEQRIFRAIIKGKTRDFWTLAERGVLPSETMNYVPKFLAAVMVGENPQKYGLVAPEGDAQPGDRVLVPVAAPVPVASVAKVAGVELEVFRKDNPHLRGSTTPGGRRYYEVWVPKDKAETVSRSRLARVKAPEPAASKVRVVASSKAIHHRVKRGETLYSIARRYGMTVAALKRENQLRSSRVQVGQKLRVAQSKAPRRLKYRVKRGDTLTRISSRFGVTVSHIKRLNDLDSSEIWHGQTLTIQPSAL